MYEPGEKPMQWVSPREPLLQTAKRAEQAVSSRNMLTKSQADDLLVFSEQEGMSSQYLALATSDIRILVPAYHATTDSMFRFQPSRPISVTWGVPDLCVVHGVNVAGTYTHTEKRGEIAIAAPLPTDAEQLKNLVFDGRAPDAYQVFIHERDHAIQLSQPGDVSRLNYVKYRHIEQCKKQLLNFHPMRCEAI